MEDEVKHSASEENVHGVGTGVGMGEAFEEFDDNEDKTNEGGFEQAAIQRPVPVAPPTESIFSSTISRWSPEEARAQFTGTYPSRFGSSIFSFGSTQGTTAPTPGVNLFNVGSTAVPPQSTVTFGAQSTPAVPEAGRAIAPPTLPGESIR